MHRIVLLLCGLVISASAQQPSAPIPRFEGYPAVETFKTRPFPLAASNVKWGSPQDDLQLGVAWSRSPNSAAAVRVFLKNTGLEQREINVGYEGSEGPLYNVEIIALSRTQPTGQVSVLDINALKARTQSVPLPIDVIFEPGGVYVFTFPFSRLISVINRKDVPLQDLLEQGYSIKASFKIPGLSLLSPVLTVNEK